MLGSGISNSSRLASTELPGSFAQNTAFAKPGQSHTRTGKTSLGDSRVFTSAVTPEGTSQLRRYHRRGSGSFKPVITDSTVKSAMR